MMSEFKLSPLLENAQNGSLVVETGSLAGQRFGLPPAPGALLLGRERICNVRFDPDRERLVGRTHARIEVRPDGVFLVDLNSANGTYQEGGQKVSGRIPLHTGMRFQLGGEGGPWLSVVLPLPVESAVTHARPFIAEAETIMTRAEPIAQHTEPAVFIRPTKMPAPAVERPDAEFAENAPLAVHSAHSEIDSRVAAIEGRLAVDPQAVAYRRAYLRQIAIIALILLLACGVGVLIGTSGGAAIPERQESSVR